MFIGIDIGGTQIKSALVAADGSLSSKGLIDTPQEKEAILQALYGIITDLQAKAIISGIGISAPGVITRDGFFLTAGAVRGLYGLHLKKDLEERFSLPVFVENDGKAAAIAERWLGHAQSVDNYLCIVLGTGVGGGIVLNGQVLRGMTGAAGEFSWMLTESGQEQIGIEAYLAGHMGVLMGLCERFNQKEIAVNPAFEPTRSALSIFEQEASNPRAAAAIEEYVQEVARNLWNMVAIFNPERILIGGGISANPDFIDRVHQALRDVMDQHIMIQEVKDQLMPQVGVAGLRNDAGLLGAVYQLQEALKKEE
ncbi:Transcriptional regulator/sugar kinase [Streptococcus sp. DD10]|uniref:ROK family protein n=1 Tax=Streptococcus sp. DD10 TaxID=1777878 RepID=UPI000797248C|nr:ROK family protein [Streptococcus sp. DD10]KXT74690.1 Transcriptional regulator/sugar kinase [Streptococcus sp. DD10]